MRTRMMLGMVLALSSQVAARGQTWDGGGTTNNWTDAVNWSNNNAPANNGTATPNFAGNTRLGPIVNVNFDVNGVTFDNAAGAFVISSSGGAALGLRAGGITNNNAGVGQAFNVPIVLGAAQTWGGVGSLTINGTVNLNGRTLTANTPAVVSINGAVSGSSPIIKNGAGALVLSGNNASFSGGVTLSEGTLAIGINAGLGTGVLTIDGGKIEATGGSRTIANAVSVRNDFAIPSGTALTLTGPITLQGNHTLTNSIATLAISGVLGEDVPGRELTLAGGGTLALSGNGLTLGTSLKQNSGTLTATGLINTAGHTLTQNAGTFTGSLINRGSFVYNGGTHSGNIANESGGDASFNANLTLTAALNNFGTVRVANSRTLTFGTQHLNNAGIVDLAGGTLSASGSTSFVSSGIVGGYGTITTNNTSFNNSGLIQVSGGNLTLASNFSFTNSGTISVPSARQLQWNSAAGFGNVGLVQLSGGTVAGTGSLSNNAGGEIRGSGTIQSALTNAGGRVRATGNESLTIVNLFGNNTGGGELRVDENSTMNIQSAFNSSGTMVLGGPNATLNLNSVTNTGTFRGQGRTTGTVLNGGIVRAEGGTLTFASSGSTNTVAGRLESGAGSQLLYTQGLATNAGLVALTGGSLDNNNVALANPGRIEGYGTLRTGGLTNSGTLSVGGSLDVIGAVTHSGVVSTTTGSNVRFFGPVTGAGSYTGSGTVTFLNTFSPGASPAAVSFGGDLELAGSSNLVIELGGTTPGIQYDTLSLVGTAALGGALHVDLLGGFTPTPGSTFQIVTAPGGVDGKFASASLPALSGASWQLRYSSNAVLLQVALTGDFNFDGKVDAADYTFWRDSLGQSGAGLAADGNGNGHVDAADYGVWKSHFGNVLGSGSLGVAGPPHLDLAAVPEPSSALLLGVILGAGACSWRRHIAH